MNDYLEKNCFTEKYESKWYANGRIADFRSEELTEFEDLIASIFGHPRAIFDRPSDIKSKTTSHFFNCILKSKICKGIRHDLGTVELSPEQFSKVLFQKSPPIGRNEIVFLVGTVGTGKTTLINRLISVEFRNLVDSNDLFFVRIDIESVHGRRLPTVNKLILAIGNKIKDILSKPGVLRNNYRDCRDPFNDLKRLLDGANPECDTDCRQVLDRVQEILRRIRQRGRKIYIILDNIDYICYLNSPRIISENDKTDGTGEADHFTCFRDFLEKFFAEDQLARLSSTIVIVGRPETYNPLKAIMTTSWEDFSERSECYAIIPPSEVDYLESKVKMLEYYKEHEAIVSAENMERINRLIDVINKNIEGDSDMPLFLSYIKGVSRFGYREIVKYFIEAIWSAGDDLLYDSKKENFLFNRFVKSYPVGMIYYMLDGNILFEQFKSYFCNVFLVNIIPSRAIPGHVLSHPHSYLLKWLIVSSCMAKPYSTIDELVTDMCSGKGYSENMVLASLNSMSDANSCNVMTFDREVITRCADKSESFSFIYRHLAVSERGRFLFDKIISRFFYLQLIIDDPNLPLPRAFKRPPFNFKYAWQEDDEPMHYGYIARKDPHRYMLGLCAMIERKAYQVLCFVELLKECYALEMEIYPDAFKRAMDRITSNDDSNQIFAPNLDSYLEQVKSELSDLEDKLSGNLDLSNVYERFNKDRAHIPAAASTLYQRNWRSRRSGL
ncbi:ATP-binding protein [Cerasicoccus maritimus]|uniref:ATP-binding protein n=1 Tax=Cerasicoccus maritimus TaxID=490089 RepID=UPI002852D43D|nr:ATP-binding protein [Cerasicoccus maritimus]